MSRFRQAFLMATLEQYLGLLIGVGTIAAMARLLTPAEIGLGVIGLGIGTIVFSLREFASPDFLIKRDHVDIQDVRTSFTVLLALTTGLSLLLYLGRGWLAEFYHDRSLLYFLDLLIVAAFIETLSLPTIALLRRDMAFGILARVRTVGSAVAASTTIGLAVFGGGHMSFAFGLLSGALTTTLLAFAARPVVSIFRPSVSSLRDALHFGSYMGATSVLNKIYETLPQLLLGRIMTPSSVGIFNRANAVCSLPDRVFLSAVFSVAFPVLAEQVRQGESLRASYLRAISYITVVYWPSQILLALLAYPTVRIILGENWSDAPPIVAILCLASTFWFPVILTYPLLIALGENREAFVSNCIARIASAVVLCSAAFWGLTALALSQFITLPFQMMVSLYFVRKHVQFEWAHLMEAIRPSAIVTAGAMVGPVIVIAAHGFDLDISPLAGFLAGILAIMGWLTALVKTRHPFLTEVDRIWQKVRPLMPLRGAGKNAAGPSSVTPAE
ncbi:polysaccharide biosynthesis protein [Phyllobacterium phragmitis]|uniref:Polysaccharide biosynthesis protein n=1 Tax=Phyllobacterium phragmitis TaxID=2670329 RepID=A0A2S9IMB6_9HYPH|nr:oligosaccharide flippase family protein [Phyllobacterium phragmitis]PRD41622.1 polysaccharide biosynthesis protein [Phyllobacterium phragmitis]